MNSPTGIGGGRMLDDASCRCSPVLVYECGLPGGRQKAGADLMRVDHDGKVIEWRCHY